MSSVFPHPYIPTCVFIKFERVTTVTQVMQLFRALPSQKTRLVEKYPVRNKLGGFMSYLETSLWSFNFNYVFECLHSRTKQIFQLKQT